MNFASLNSPPLVATAGAAVVLGLPALEVLTASSASLALLKGANVVAFLTNVGAVSVPGRMDGQQDQAMRQGSLNPSKPTQGEATSSTPLASGDSNVPIYTSARTRTLVNPSGWAFAIWGPIYLGEAAFVTAATFASEGSALAGVLPQVTAPFVAANILQSLWCASFRPSYSEGWKKYVSVGMLAGTAFSLSHVQAVGCAAAATIPWWYFLPMTVHFGWTTAATLVNLNGSIAMQSTTSDSTLVAAGHASALTAAAVGVGVTLAQSVPAYGLTLAWALAACADGMSRRIASGREESDVLKKGADVQKKLCWAGSLACVASAIAASVLL